MTLRRRTRLIYPAFGANLQSHGYADGALIAATLAERESTEEPDD